MLASYPLTTAAARKCSNLSDTEVIKKIGKGNLHAPEKITKAECAIFAEGRVSLCSSSGLIRETVGKTACY
jgi:hypothetical protein